MAICVVQTIPSSGFVSVSNLRLFVDGYCPSVTPFSPDSLIIRYILLVPVSACAGRGHEVAEGFSACLTDMILSDFNDLKRLVKTLGADGTQNTRNVHVISENAHNDTADM